MSAMAEHLHCSHNTP